MNIFPIQLHACEISLSGIPSVGPLEFFPFTDCFGLGKSSKLDFSTIAILMILIKCAVIEETLTFGNINWVGFSFFYYLKAIEAELLYA
jgi:hypothetical protein